MVALSMVSLLLAAAMASPTATQVRVDQLVHRCRAERVVRLVAQGHAEVVMNVQHPERPPSSDENRKFECVLQGMQGMKDLRFGFLGNEEAGR